MRKIGAMLMALVMAVPALATPVCAAACGGGDTVRTSCCCAPRAVPTDGNASYTAPPCCPSDSARADLRELDGAVSPGSGTQAAVLSAQPLAAAVVVAADALPGTSVAHFTDPGGASPTGPPIFIAVSSLRL